MIRRFLASLAVLALSAPAAQGKMLLLNGLGLREARLLKVDVGDQARGAIPGADFARAFFSTWLGAYPPNPGLQEGLLGVGR